MLLYQNLSADGLTDDSADVGCTGSLEVHSSSCFSVNQGYCVTAILRSSQQKALCHYNIGSLGKSLISSTFEESSSPVVLFGRLVNYLNETSAWNIFTFWFKSIQSVVLSTMLCFSSLCLEWFYH